jgi:hypothetical protein
MPTEVHKVVDIHSINKVRSYYGLRPLTKKSCQCSKCGKPFVTFQGEIWCNTCRHVIHKVFRFEERVASQTQIY